MKKLLKISTIFQNKLSYSSVTISPKDNYFEATFYLKERTAKGKPKMRTEKYENVSESELLPEISNYTVKHLGYTKYFHHAEDNFYINLYFN